MAAPLTCHGTNRPSIDIPRETVIINGPLVILQSPQGRLAVMSRAGSMAFSLHSHGSPPEQLEPSGPSIDIPRGVVIINGPLVILHSPQGRLRCLEPEWLSSHGSPPLTCHGPTDPPLEFTAMS